MKRLIPDQIREAGSNTFLEIESGSKVKTRHTTVTDFFLQSAAPTGVSGDHCDDHLCPKCKSEASIPQTWKLSKKEGHLRMAITVCKIASEEQGT